MPPGRDSSVIPVTPEKAEKSDKKFGKIVPRQSCSNFIFTEKVVGLGKLN
jgi:hypothetical protein